MATRDLTMRFLRQRSSAASRPRNATADGLLGSGAAGAGGQWNTGAIAGMQPQYVDLMDEINSDVNTIKGKSEWFARSGRRVASTSAQLRDLTLLVSVECKRQNTTLSLARFCS